MLKETMSKDRMPDSLTQIEPDVDVFSCLPSDGFS